MIELVALDDGETNRGARRTHDAYVRQSCHKSLSKTLARAKTDQFCGHDSRVAILPAVVPNLRQSIDLSGFGGSYVHGMADILGNMVATHVHEISTTGQGDAHDITPAVAGSVAQSRLNDGTATAFVVGSTAGITTIEFEPGAVHDLNAVFEILAPRHAEYRHHLRWGDDNGSSHARAALLGPSVTVPFKDGKLLLGTWQQIALFEFDTRPRQREIVVQILGE